MTKFSIIIPVFNAQELIYKSINSILEQTLTDYEIICVNDGSTDSTSEILQNYAKQDNRVTIIEQQNQGQGRARNKGLLAAKGDYIYFIDQDDWIDFDMLEEVYAKIYKYNPDIIEIPHIYEYISKTKPHKLKFKLPENNTFNYKINKDYLFGTSLAGWSRFVKRELVAKYNIRFSEYRTFEDYIYAINAKIHAEKIVFLNSPKYHYCINSSSVSNSVAEGKIEAIDSLLELKNLLIETKIFEIYEKSFAEFSVISLADIYNHIPENKKELFLIQSRYLLLDNYGNLINHIKNNSLSFAQQIFSIKNENNRGKLTKILTILGHKYVIKNNVKE